MKQIEVAAAIIQRENRIFATQRGYGKFKGMWEFPGGKLEPGETPEEALIREIREELDAEIHIDRLFATIEYDYPDFHLTMHCYLCTLAADHLVLLEHSNAKWLDQEHLFTVDWLPADISLIHSLKVLLNG